MREEDCIRRLRFTKEAMTEICQLLRPQLQPQSRARTVLPLVVKVTVPLNFYGSGSFQASAGDMCKISQFAVHCCTREVRDALYEMRNRLITFPFDRDKQNERARGFVHIAGFPMVQGAIDCTHIALHAPYINSAAFVNRKDFLSLNMQLVCDHMHRIMEVDARYSGSSHNAFVIRQSNVPAIFHSAWNPRTRAEQTYSESHAATRKVVEHIIGLFKQCFRCLRHSGGFLQYSTEQVGRFVMECYMLHNRAIMRN
ncbi:putative nuclease HARBI1 [Heptranchias perlo]|uniref:putative nuclease HARBI1 n=1 Tax=Heptranchias perlo TaxID=212740 RepID=UPI003559537C